MLGSVNLGPSVFWGFYCIFVKNGPFVTKFGTRGTTDNMNILRDCLGLYKQPMGCDAQLAQTRGRPNWDIVREDVRDVYEGRNLLAYQILMRFLSQSMAEIKLLPVSENGRPPYWNFTSGFDFNLCIVSGMSFCVCLLIFVIIRRSAELWRHIDFSRWRP